MVDGNHEPGVTNVYSADERPQICDSVVVKAMVCFEDDVHNYATSEGDSRLSAQDRVCITHKQATGTSSRCATDNV